MNSVYNGTQLYFKNSSNPYFSFKQYAGFVNDMISLNNYNAFLLAVDRNYLSGVEFSQNYGDYNFTDIGRFNLSSNSSTQRANWVGLSSAYID
jgi:hypothetical protein